MEHKSSQGPCVQGRWSANFIYKQKWKKVWFSPAFESMKMHLSDWCHIDLKGSGLTVIGWLLGVNWSEQHFKSKTIVMDRIIGTQMKQINPFI